LAKSKIQDGTKMITPEEPSEPLRGLVNDLFFSNKSTAALARDAEAECAKHGPAPVNLRAIQRGDWDNWLNCDVTLPPAVQKYLAAHPKGQPLTSDEVQNLECVVEQWHGISPPFYVTMTLTLQTIGRPWQYVETQNLTGFTLGKDQ
jgi:hypothetical protein